ncbi:hypothetical protein F503_04363 [Ophiostoma piceae UAMH 11346]|uniref:Uncharacterized protein n=1 Tax=Ophiostoma piceae (strain UAMH 11346) TaxID=1262450 RepID=S3CA36_OPHP1|nr:hypothetical protein F503_04363 [Ophiostoma piceae UAMH 11346]
MYIEESFQPAPLKNSEGGAFQQGSAHLLRLLVLGRNTLQRDNEVLERALLLVALGALAVHQVVEANGVLEHVVDTSHDTENTEGEDPNTDNSDNGSLLAVHEETEQGEEGGQQIDDQDGTGQLPRGDGRPEGAVGTGDENQPVLSKGDLKEDDLIKLTEVLDDTTVLGVGVHGSDSDPGANSQNNTEQDGHTPELGQVPLDGSLGEGSVIVSNGQGSDISENGNEDDQLNVQRTVEDGNPQTQVDLEMDGQSDTVDNVGVHAVENLSGSLQGINNGTKTGGKENDIGSGASSVRGTLDSNTGISLLQGGSIVDTVTSHGNEVATLLQDLDDVVLVLGENLGETIGSLNEIVNLGTGHVTTATKTQALSVVDVGTKAKLARSLASNTDSITSKHLDGQTQGLGLVDSAGGIVARGVRAGHDTENLPRTTITLAGNTKGTETTGSELGNLVLVGLVDVLGDGVVLLDGLENEQRGTLDTGNALTSGGLDNSGNLLGDGVEGEEVDNLVLGQNGLGAGVVAEGLEESLVDGINTLLLAGSSETGSKHQVLGVDAGNSEGVLSNNATVSGDDGTLLDLEDITGNNLRSLNLLQGAVTEDDSLQGQSLLQLIDNGTSLVLLDETDDGVQQQQSADDTEIDPILKTGSQDSGSL